MHMFCLAGLTFLDRQPYRPPTLIVAPPLQHYLNRYLAICQRGSGRFAKAKPIAAELTDRDTTRHCINSLAEPRLLTVQRRTVQTNHISGNV